MKTVQAIALTAAGVIVYSLFRKKAGLGSLNFFPDKIRDFGFEGGSPVLLIGIGVQNTSNQSYTLNSLAGNLSANGTYIGNVSVFTPVNIPPNSQAVIPVKARLSWIGVVSDIFDALNYHHFSQTIKLEATANIDNLQIPITQTIKAG